MAIVLLDQMCKENFVDHEVLKEKSSEQEVNRHHGQGGHEVQSYLAENVILFPNGNLIH